MRYMGAPRVAGVGARYPKRIPISRTGDEPGVPGTWTWAGLLEPRYVLVVSPFLRLLAVVGSARPWRARRDSRNAM